MIKTYIIQRKKTQQNQTNEKRKNKQKCDEWNQFGNPIEESSIIESEINEFEQIETEQSEKFFLTKHKW